MREIEVHSADRNRLASIACWLLFATSMFKWVLLETIFYSSLLNYISFIVPFGLFVIVLLKNRNHLSLDTATKIWIPWFLYIFAQTIIYSNLERFCFHFICLALLLLSTSIRVRDIFPKKLALYIGIFSMIGIGIELFLPSFYSSTIAPFFISEHADTSSYGLKGFTYQFDVSAAFIMLFEMIWIYFYKDNVKPSIFWLVLIVSLLCIFLTGKRMHAILAVIIPLFVYVVSKKSLTHILFLSIIIGLISYILILYFIHNYTLFEDNLFLHRLSHTVELAQAKEDITSDRTILYDLALNAWREYPILGIGDSNFIQYAGSETSVHNAYLQTLCEQGLIGFILWIIPIIYCFIITCYLLRHAFSASGSVWLKLSLFCQTQFILYGLTGNPTVNIDRYVLYFLSIAILAKVHLCMRHPQTNSLQ